MTFGLNGYVPVGCRREVDDLLAWNVMWHKVWNWMADEHVGLLDIAP
jgi:hypothetical protein